MTFNLEQVQHHPAIEDIAQVLSKKTQNADMPFLRVMVAFFLGKMASTMRAAIVTKDRGAVPINIYSLSLAVSGAGKGHSVNLLEDSFCKGFKDRFLNETMPAVSDLHLWQIANKRALRGGTQPEDEHKALDLEFKRMGAMAYTFDSGTVPAVKQLRHKLLMANCGAINLQIDEIGSNLIGATEVLNVFLELYDQGMVKNKLTKNTVENQRSEEIDGKTPTNMLLFGTPSKLLDGGKTEDEFYSFLETGYARRCLFAYGQRIRASDSMTPEEVYAQLTDKSNEAVINTWSNHFLDLADILKFDWKIKMDDAVGIELLRYRAQCEHEADKLPEHEEIRKAELSHRYFKTLKLAGAYAFIDESPDLTIDHLLQAMKLVEESGKAFQRIFTREKAYARLAKYLANVGSEQTHADLSEALPFYKGGASARNELMNLAIAWGYKNNIIVRKQFMEGIEFFQGKSLEETDLDKMIVSYSNHIAYNYRSEKVPFKDLYKLTQMDNYHWINHHLEGGATGQGHRAEDNALQGFNMLVIDVDKGASFAAAQELLKEYTYLMYTTKRHTDDDNRFRIVLPMNYKLEMDADEYREFMANVFSWFPFEVDTATNQRARKWLSHDGEYIYNEGQPLDVLQFIPKTSRNEEFKSSIIKLENLDNLERWFAQRMVSGNRNNHMIRFAMALVDSGLNYAQVEERVLSFNGKLDNGLPVDELRQTVLKSIASKLQSLKP